VNAFSQFISLNSHGRWRDLIRLVLTDHFIDDIWACLRKCHRCGAEFIIKRESQRFCSNACRSTRLCDCGQPKSCKSKWCKICRKGKPTKLVPITCVSCGTMFQPKQLTSRCCSVECGKWWTATRERERHNANRSVSEERRRARNRRASKIRRSRGAMSGRTAFGRWRTIGTRDGWICWLCLGPVDPNENSRSRMGPTCDHIIPVSCGGSNDVSNLKLAHRSCNSRRQHRAHMTVLASAVSPESRVREALNGPNSRSLKSWSDCG
jgi:hypothetical protein